jgi:Tol biopolymer transport system component
MVVTPVFSPDGRHLAYRARKNGKRFVVLADREASVVKEGPVHDAVWQPVFSTDGKHVAYGAVVDNGIWWKVETVD